MMYATVTEVAAGFRTLTVDEMAVCEALLNEAAIIIDSYNENADEEIKALVSCRMVRRGIGDAQVLPLGATQGTITAGGYSQSWTNAGGSGELYLSRVEKKLLGAGNAIGSYSPVQELVPEVTT